ncbi:MAG: hypothetical protein ORN58_07455 [Sediminibacterium sp.]|nr:hypothetical protein [Sediminibacterium sp.]
MDNMILIYFIIGIVYTLVNIFVRKLDTNGDYLLPFIWLLLWPIAFIVLIINKFTAFNHKG